jgi:hypothetical protein
MEENKVLHENGLQRMCVRSLSLAPQNYDACGKVHFGKLLLRLRNGTDGRTASAEDRVVQNVRTILL